MPTLPVSQSRSISMQAKYIQSVGLVLTLLYATFIVWIYVTAPASLAEVATQTRAATGTYEGDQKHFDAALQLFRADQFHAAREEWALSHPLQRDAHTQVSVAYR